MHFLRGKTFFKSFSNFLDTKGFFGGFWYFFGKIQVFLAFSEIFGFFMNFWLFFGFLAFFGK